MATASKEKVMDIGTKQRVLSRLTRVGGQIGGIRRMVEEDRHGVGVIHQIAAAQAALCNAILKAQVESGLVEAVASADKAFSRYGHIRQR